MENEESKKGKALSGLSAALIVYSLAGGSLSGSGSIFGSAVTVENPTVVEVSIIVFLFYLAYRYLIELPHPIKKFTGATMVHIKRDKMFNKYKKKLLDNRKREINEGKGQDEKVNSISFFTNKPIDSGSIKKSRNGYTISLLINLKPGGTETITPKLETWRVWFYGLKTIFYKEVFWVVILPWVLFGVAMLLIMLRTIGVEVVINPADPLTCEA